MDAPKTIMKCDVRREGCAARIDGVDDDDEHEGLDGREAQEEEFGSRKRHAHSIVVNQASKSEWSTR